MNTSNELGGRDELEGVDSLDQRRIFLTSARPSWNL